MIRIGSVPYLNAKVLVHGLAPHSKRYSLEFYTPATLVQKLQDGELDVALVSSIEYFRRPDYSIVPDVSISAHREMWSTLLFHRVPLREARRIGLDPASHTTNALARVILREKMQLSLELVEMADGGAPAAREDLDGFVMIGDPCLVFSPPSGYKALDLAAEWHSFTQLPFVFALWLTRKGLDLDGVNVDLCLAKRDGLRHVDAIAREHAPRIGLDVARVKQYIAKIVYYDLGPLELDGLDLFRKHLIRLGLVPPGSGFDFYRR